MQNDVRPLSPPPHVLSGPQEGAPPTRATPNGDAPFPKPSNYLLKFPVNGLPTFPSTGPYRERHPSPELSSTPFPQSPR